MTSKVKALLILMLLAILSTCVLSSSVISGEHPWDSDRHYDTLVTPPPVVDTVKVVVGTTRSDGSGGGTASTASYSSRQAGFADFMQRFMFKLVWSFTQKYYQTAGQGSSQVDRW